VNRLHHWYCSREAWKRHVREDLVPAALGGVELGSHVLEVGPGFGPATEALARRAARVTALEIDQGLAASLPFGDESFTGAACFTMLHHVPSAEAQDRLFAEVARVLRPGAPFAGTDSTGRGVGFALLHVGDTKVVIDPQSLGQRLVSAGFATATVSAGRDAVRFCASMPSN